MKALGGLWGGRGGSWDADLQGRKTTLFMRASGLRDFTLTLRQPRGLVGQRTPMTPALPHHTVSDQAEEIARQFDLLSRVEWVRTITTCISYGMMAMFLPLWIPLVALCVDLAMERLGLSLMRGLDPALHRTRYLASLLSVGVMELAYTLPPVLIWQLEHPFAKAIAIGAVTMTLLQLTTVRAIHLPYGLMGWGVVAAVTLIGNAVYWADAGDVQGLVLSSFAALGAVGYTFTAMASNHELHTELMRRGKAAEAANDAKSRFLAQMSHELRTPLNAILGMGQAELALAQTPETAERLGILVASAQSLGVILDDILDMSAIREGLLPIRRGPTDLRAEIDSTVAMYRALFQQAGLTLDLHLGDDLPARALLDAQRLRQCLSNLLSNALKHTRKGGATVCVRQDPMGMLSLIVTDTGAGISPAVQDAIFEPFQRGPGPVPGTGLGLSISRALARRMGGDLDLLPNATGARFRLTVALDRVEEGVSIPAPALPPREAKLDLGGRLILVVDDISTNRFVAATHLRLMGAAVAEAASGTEAVAEMQARRPDLVLLDMNMPDLNGIETLRLLRALPEGAKLPVVAMTADATEAHRRHYLDQGLDGYVAKPLSTASLAAALAPHLAAG
jgi:signal transduction histidine kinase/CheY-like chemotaxis protein